MTARPTHCVSCKATLSHLPACHALCIIFRNRKRLQLGKGRARLVHGRLVVHWLRYTLSIRSTPAIASVACVLNASAHQAAMVHRGSASCALATPQPLKGLYVGAKLHNVRKLCAIVTWHGARKLTCAKRLLSAAPHNLRYAKWPRLSLRGLNNGFAAYARPPAVS